MNEKGSMTKELLFKYFIYVFSKFYPNSCDVDGKRVLVLIDGGPGQSNLEMLAQLRVKGIYLFPSGPPNTTHVLQVMDQLFGPFKTFYQQNFELLWNYRLQLPPDHKQHGKINRTDIGALIFGASLENGKELIDAFSKAFSAERVQYEWAKVGLSPFNRASLENKAIRHELVHNNQGTIDLTADPQSKYIQLLKNTNVMACEILDSFHANGGLLRAKTIVRNSTQRRNQLTKPHSRERQDAISTANSQGDIFLRTGCVASNCDDVFIAIKRKRLHEEQNQHGTRKESK